MNWFERKRQNFLNKSWFGKLTDILFVVLIITILTPGGRVFYQRVLLQTGIFNASVNISEPISKSVNYAHFEFQNIENKSIVRSHELKNKVLFINIWATWCPPCKAELPSLARLYKHYKNDTNIVFLFASGESLEKLQNFYRQLDYDMPLMKLNSLPKELDYNSLPTTFVLNKNGELIHKTSGMASWDTEAVFQQLDVLKNQ